MRRRAASLALLLALSACFTDDGATSDTTATTATSTGVATTVALEPSTGTSTGTGTGSTGEPATSTGDELPSCAGYCEVYEAACADFSVYDHHEACLAQCAQWPVGLVDVTVGDSVGCRTYHAGVALGVDPDIHCAHAGPSGAGSCVASDGPGCLKYCELYAVGCNDALYVYTGIADCLAQCATWYPGHESDTKGDTIGCRTYHASVAADEPALHCPHAGPGGGGVCVAPLGE